MFWWKIRIILQQLAVYFIPSPRNLLCFHHVKYWKLSEEAYDWLQEDLDEADPEAYLDLTLDDEKSYLDKYTKYLESWLPAPQNNLISIKMWRKSNAV